MTEFISLSGSKPDVLISESSNTVNQHSISQHSTTAAATVLPNTGHSGVYVVAKDTNSNTQTLHSQTGNCMYTGHEWQTCFKPSLQSKNILVCTSQARQFHSVKQCIGPCSLGIAVPCSVDYESGPHETYPISRDQRTNSQQIMSGCCSNIPQLSCNHNPVTCHLHIHCDNKQSRMTTLANNGLAYGQVLLHSQLQPSGETKQTLNDCSNANNLPQPQSNQMPCLGIHHSSSSLQISSQLSESAPTASSLTPFHTPEKYFNGRLLNGLSPTMTSASLSPGSICKSSSFHSCSSHLSIGN